MGMVEQVMVAAEPLRPGAQSLLRRIFELSPGERLTYHEGDLASDCHHAAGVRREAARAVRQGAQLASAWGYCLLVQRRLGENAYAYIAVRLG